MSFIYSINLEIIRSSTFILKSTKSLVCQTIEDMTERQFPLLYQILVLVVIFGQTFGNTTEITSLSRVDHKQTDDTSNPLMTNQVDSNQIKEESGVRWIAYGILLVPIVTIVLFCLCFVCICVSIHTCCSPPRTECHNSVQTVNRYRTPPVVANQSPTQRMVSKDSIDHSVRSV